MRATIERTVDIHRGARALQLEGMFDIPPSAKSELVWDVDLPVEQREWHVGLIVGPSGSGKSTMVRELWPEQASWRVEWPDDRAVVDAFPDALSVKEVVALLSSVGFSSPPSWLRPYRVLSTGEQFRVDIARRLAERAPITVVDEFTSVVDRTVAKVASAAITKSVREREQRFIAATCHTDVVEWLQPDWVYDTGAAAFSWRSVQPRPKIALEVFRTTADAWALFRRHHYLTGDVARQARCFIALIDGKPAAFSSMVNFPHPRVPHALRMHRTVTLPDFQGVSIGNRLAEIVASVGKARGYRVYATQSHPAVNGHQSRSPLWFMTRSPGRVAARGRTSTIGKWGQSVDRLTASFEYVGPPATGEVLRALSW